MTLSVQSDLYLHCVCFLVRNKLVNLKGISVEPDKTGCYVSTLVTHLIKFYKGKGCTHIFFLISIDHQCKCSKSAMWEFRKQDANRDSILSPKEMEAFSANRREPCMAALLKSCDTDSDGAVTHGEWCCCMAYTSKCSGCWNKIYDML
jgi:hypothetical protein